MFKNAVKFSGMVAGIGILGVTVLFLVQYFKSRNNPEYQVMQNLKELERKYAEDTYGGDTPEETLRLFIEALKASDTELAAKYFILDKQREWKESLAKIKDNGLLDDTIKDLERLRKKYPLSNGGDRFIFEFETRQEPNELTVQADITMGPNGKWKILDL